MSAITVLVLIFSIPGAADYLLGNKFGVGKEFEKAFSLFCTVRTNWGSTAGMAFSGVQ